MKVAYVTAYDAHDVQYWSGSGYYIAHALKRQSIDVEFIGPLDYKAQPFLAKTLFYKLRGKRYWRDREPAVVRSFAHQIEKQLNQSHYDLVFCPGSTHPISYLECRHPIVFWTDAVVSELFNFYPDWTNLCQETIASMNQQEQLALAKCHLALYSSHWAAHSALRNYQVDPRKVKVVPFGANIQCDRTLADIRTLIKHRSTHVCKLLLVGVNWYRKGADLAVKVAERLTAAGLTVELTIVGCHPPADVPTLPDFVKLTGFISKRTPAGQAALTTLFEEAHFFMLPSRAECAAVALAEACSFGVPVVASNVGGIGTIVNDHVNGIALPLEAFEEQACNFILQSIQEQNHYNQLAEAAFQEYEQRLNWQVSGQKVAHLLHNLVVPV